MYRFFISQSDINGIKATLTGQEVYHLSVVLRLTTGNTIFLFDGTGNTYKAIIKKISKTKILTEIITCEKPGPANQPVLHLGQAILQNKRMNLVIQKAAELGITSIQPYTSRHCTIKHISQSKKIRWQRIALEACKQCGRAAPPIFHSVSNLTTLLATCNNFDLKLFFWEKEGGQTLQDIFKQTALKNSVFLLVGPESGFSSQEADKAISAGFKPVSLGKHILRAETASITAIAILQHLLGNLQ